MDECIFWMYSSFLVYKLFLYDTLERRPFYISISKNQSENLDQGSGQVLHLPVRLTNILSYGTFLRGEQDLFVTSLFPAHWATPVLDSGSRGWAWSWSWYWDGLCWDVQIINTTMHFEMIKARSLSATWPKWGRQSGCLRGRRVEVGEGERPGWQGHGRAAPCFFCQNMNLKTF